MAVKGCWHDGISGRVLVAELLSEAGCKKGQTAGVNTPVLSRAVL